MPNFWIKCSEISEMEPPATTTLAPVSAMPLIVSSIMRSSPLLYALSSSAFLITTTPFVSGALASMLQPKTATLAFATCLTDESESRCTTTPRTTCESDTEPPMSLATRTLSTTTAARLPCGGIVASTASATSPASSSS